MGMSMAGSSSCFDKKDEVKVVMGNPDPKDFYLTAVVSVNGFLVVGVTYPNCKNYEGNKILVFKELTPRALLAREVLDPHFSSDCPQLSPIARFVPTEDGWRMALKFASS